MLLGFDGKQGKSLQSWWIHVKNPKTLSAFSKLKEEVGRVLARLRESLTPLQPAVVYA